MAHAIEIRFSVPPKANDGKREYSKPRILHSVKAPYIKWDAYNKMLNTVYSRVRERGGTGAAVRAMRGVRGAVSSGIECGNFVAKGIARPSTLDVIEKARELGGKHAAALAVTTMVGMLNRDYANGTSRLRQFISYFRNTPEVQGALEHAAYIGTHGQAAQYIALRLPGKLEPRSILEALAAFRETYVEHGAEAAGEVAFEVCRISAIRGCKGLETPAQIEDRISSMRLKTLAGKPVRNKDGVLEWLPVDQQNI